MMFLSLLLSAIFFILGLIHFNWVAGGAFGFAASLPTKENGERIFTPKKRDSAVVGMGLTAFGIFYLIMAGLVNWQMPDWMSTYGAWIIPAIFILRAIGEFKYVGFFKKIRNTPFGKMDTKLFSPLCLFIGTIGIIIRLMM